MIAHRLYSLGVCPGEAAEMVEGKRNTHAFSSGVATSPSDDTWRLACRLLGDLERRADERAASFHRRWSRRPAWTEIAPGVYHSDVDPFRFDR